MTIVQTQVIVAADGSVSLATPLPVGEHSASVELFDELAISELWDRLGLPTWDLGPWPEGVHLGRDELYGDDGR